MQEWAAVLQLGQIERNLFKIEYMITGTVSSGGLFIFFLTVISVWMLEGRKQGEYQFLTNKEKYQQ